MNVRVVFMGTPDFSVPVLTSLVRSPYEVVAVYTRPDRPAGRGRHPLPSPVKRAAVAEGLRVVEPETPRSGSAIQQLLELEPDVVVVAAFSYLLPGDVLRIPRHGCLNVHPSLLPRHRGASPVASALLRGDTETGVTIMLMDEGLDTGPVVRQERVAISEEDTTGSLADRLADLGARVLVDTIEPWVCGELTARPQTDEEATYSPKIAAADGKLDWSRPAETLCREVRAYNPWPGSHTMFKGWRLKVHSAWPLEVPPITSPGTVVEVRQHGETPLVGVQTGEGVLALRSVQLEGKKESSVEEFVRGHRDFVGSSLGRELSHHSDEEERT